MKVQLKRDGEILDVSSVTITIGETKYRISENNQKEIEVNKVDFDDAAISVKPCYSNQIAIK